MTDDKDLIAMARLAQRDGRMATGALYGDLADRIEDLIAELSTCEKYRDAYAECDRIGTQAVRDLEAKLAKVVAAAGKMLDAFCVHEDSHQSAAYEAMCAALAETERESHD